MEEKHRLFIMFFILVIFGYLSYLLIAPFITYILLGLILAVLFYPFYKRTSRFIGEAPAAVLSIIVMVLLVVIPSIIVGFELVEQARNAYGLMIESGLDLATAVSYVPGVEVADIEALIPAKSKVAAALPSLISMTGAVVIGVLLFFFTMYYALKDGKEWYSAVSNILPIKRDYKHRLKEDIEQMTRVLFYGQILTSVLIGLGCGAVLWYFGIPNPVFWGFLIVIFAFLPVLGAPIVYLPMGIWLMVKGLWVPGAAVIALCTLIVFIVEYIIRPKVISKASQIHPLTVILGALGGIYLLGFVGFLIGPLVLGIFVTLMSFDYGLGE
jgi:predicted PurR-regulated permease PerM